MKSIDNDFDIQSRFQHKIDYESILLQQIGRIAQFSSVNDLENYERSIDTLLLMLPRQLRDNAKQFKKDNDITFSRSDLGKKNYDKLLEHISILLEENNLIYHTKYIKSYS